MSDEKDGRHQKPTRFRRCRSDATLEALRRTFARIMGIPPEALLIVAPSGRKVRRDASVAHLRQLWRD